MIREFILISRDSCRDLQDGDKTDLGYRWLHTCLESLSSLGRWHPQSPPPDGTALWCLAPAEKTEMHESRMNKNRLWIWGEYFWTAVETLGKKKTDKKYGNKDCHTIPWRLTVTFSHIPTFTLHFCERVFLFIFPFRVCNFFISLEKYFSFKYHVMCWILSSTVMLAVAINHMKTVI